MLRRDGAVRYREIPLMLCLKLLLLLRPAALSVEVVFVFVMYACHILYSADCLFVDSLLYFVLC